jgi:RHS repeat-associated protein
VIETDTANPAATTAWQFSYDALGNMTKSRMAPGEIVQAPALQGAPNPPGSLAATDATIDWDGDGKDERYDFYQITLAVGEQLLLTASSTAFDPVLILQKPTGGLATALFDDHSGGGTTARLLVTADVAGTWTIVVTAKEENASGSYDLQIVKDQNVIVPMALVQYDFSYDKAGNLLSTTENQAAVADVPIFGKAVTGLGVRTSYTIDALNRVTRYEQSNSAGAVSKRVNYTYRGDGSVSKISRFAGAGVNPIGTTTNSYDGMGRLTRISQAPSASAAISYGYSYDAASRMTSMTTPEGTSNFTLDATDQLLSASLTGEAYAYDSSGNRTSGGTITGTGNRLLFDGTYRYAYDAEGNRTAKYIDRDNSQSLSVNDTDVTSYGYDQRNRLVAVSHGNLWTAAQAGALANFSSLGISLPGSDLELRYSYDFADRRIRRSIDADGMAGVGGASVFYAAYAGAIRTLEIAQIASYELNGRIEWVAGEVAQRNFYGNGVDEILAVELNGNTFWTLGDHQDSVRDIVAGNGANRGQLVEHRQYDSFGKIVRRTTGPAASAPTTEGVGIVFGYAGRPLEARTGLSDNRARWYEPGSGKFINEDPSGFKGGDANLYRYVGNDPLDRVDPSGLIAETVWDVANIGMGVYSAQDNFRQGKWGWLALDVVGLAYDGIAVAVPFLPAGASAGLKAARAGNSVIHSVNAGLDVAKVSDHVHDAARAIDTTASNVRWKAATDGSRLHRQVASQTTDSMRYFDSTYMAGANRSSGIQPDMSGGRIWADITTQGQWQRHVNKYTPGFGEGIPIMYERGVGVVGTTRLLPGAGVGLSILQEGLVERLGEGHYRTGIHITGLPYAGGGGQLSDFGAGGGSMYLPTSGTNNSKTSVLTGWRWNKK